MSPILMLLALAAADPLLSLDFEQGPDLTSYPQVLPQSGAELSVVEPGDAGQGHALKIANAAPAKYAGLTLNGPFTLEPNLALQFDVRAEADGETAYIGIIVYDADDKQYWGMTEFSGNWHHVAQPIGLLRPTNGGTLKPGLTLTRINLYGRAKGDTNCRMQVWLDNLQLGAQEVAGGLTELHRISYANPPTLDWKPEPGDETPTVALSQDPEFPAEGTQEFKAHRFWFRPPQPLAAGKWYWRVRHTGELTTGWSGIESLTIPAEAHQFEPGPVPIAELLQRPHPRLLDAAARRTELGETGLQNLVRKAGQEFNGGIADDCPIWVEGDPRWPTWIDWYGKAHGGITSRAGTRLERLGESCAITADPQVVEWTKELLLKAAKWDPEGGSNASRGDIGAHHFLRGMSWCYDAVAPQLTPAEREQVRDVMVVRAQQFLQRLSPYGYSGRENNNHSWLNAYALSVAGLALLDDVPEAREWIEYVEDLYLGRFLCTLGYQGDNNEGISYWSYGLSFIIEYADLMQRVCGLNLYQHPWLSQTDRFPLYTAVPGQHAISFADTGMPNHGTIGPAVRGQVGKLATRCRDPYALWYSGAREPIDGLAPRPPVDLPPSIHYRHIGWAVFNTDLVDGRNGVSIGLRSGKFYAGHQHSDLNAFVIYAYGRELAIDGGYYDWYGSRHFKEYSTLSRAHNTILVNGEGQESRKVGADGRIAVWFDSPQFGYVQGDVSDPDVYHGQVSRFDRRLLFIKPGFVLVHDLLGAAKGPAQWDWLLHGIVPIQVDGERHRFSLTEGDASLSGTFLAPSDVKLSVTSGFPAEPVNRYSTNPVPANQYVKEYHLSATPAAKRVDDEIAAVLRIDHGRPGTQPEPLKVAGGYGAICRDGETSYELLSRGLTGPGVIEGQRVAAEASVAAGAFVGDQPVAAMLADGRRVSLGGLTMLESDRPICGSWEVFGENYRVAISTPSRCALTVRSAGRPSTLLLDGQPVTALFDPKPQTLSLVVPAGEHTLVYGREPQQLLPHELPGVPVTGFGQEVKLEGYDRPLGRGRAVYHWGAFELSQPAHCVFQPDGEASLSLDGQPLATEQRVWVTAGRHYLSAAGPLTALAVAVSDERLHPSELLPKPYRPEGPIVVIEAETPVAEGRVKGQIMEKVGASNGLAHCVWDTPGQWAEWLFTVAVENDYELLIRGCGEHEDVWRDILLDGQPLFRDGGVVRLGATGGWSRDRDDWRYFRIPGAVHLTRGEHRLRLSQLGGSLNLDDLVWRAVE